MPKKTRKQKIQSALRQNTPPNAAFTYQLPTLKGRQTHGAPVTPYIKTDIIKTVILGVIFISLQIAISLLIKSNGW